NHAHGAGDLEGRLRAVYHRAARDRDVLDLRSGDVRIRISDVSIVFEGREHYVTAVGNTGDRPRIRDIGRDARIGGSQARRLLSAHQSCVKGALDEEDHARRPWSAGDQVHTAV